VFFIQNSIKYPYMPMPYLLSIGLVSSE